MCLANFTYLSGLSPAQSFLWFPKIPTVFAVNGLAEQLFPMAHAEQEPVTAATIGPVMLTLSQVVKRDDRLSPLDTFVTSHVIGSHDSYEIGFRPLASGEELLVYLHWATGISGYVLAFGPNGAYKVVNGALHPFGRSPVARQHDGAILSSVVTELQAATHLKR